VAPLTHPDLTWFFPRPRLKDPDPSLADVRGDYGEAIADRVKAHGLYAPASGTDGIYVATVRALVQSAAMAPSMAKRKVFVVGDADRMVPQEGSEFAANAFLKLLEEPPADTNLILTSSEPGALLPTIRSRVVSVRVPLLSEPAVREFVSDERVTQRLRHDGVKGSPDELAQLAGGAPGHLLDHESRSVAAAQAKRLLDAATSSDRAARYQASLSQGSARARGSFSDTLDALTGLLHERAQAAVARRDDVTAVGAARAVSVVERAKEQASGNANPQLVSAALLRELGGLL
jgi:DNA polymerase-3 subunit delta'